MKTEPRCECHSCTQMRHAMWVQEQAVLAQMDTLSEHTPEVWEQVAAKRKNYQRAIKEYCEAIHIPVKHSPRK